MPVSDPRAEQEELGPDPLPAPAWPGSPQEDDIESMDPPKEWTSFENFAIALLLFDYGRSLPHHRCSRHHFATTPQNMTLAMKPQVDRGKGEGARHGKRASEKKCELWGSGAERLLEGSGRDASRLTQISSACIRPPRRKRCSRA